MTNRVSRSGKTWFLRLDLKRLCNSFTVLSWKSQLPCCEAAQATLWRDPCGEDSTSSTNILGMGASHLASGSSSSSQAFCSPSLWADLNPNHQSEPLPWMIIVVLNHQVLRKFIYIHNSQNSQYKEEYQNFTQKVPHRDPLSSKTSPLAKIKDLHILTFGSPLEPSVGWLLAQSLYP